MADRLFTSLEADERISELSGLSKLDKAIICRLAFTYSLVTIGKEVAKSVKFDGGEMKRTTFVGNDELFIKSLINIVYQQSEIDENELYSNNSIIKNHIDNGALLLWQLYKNNGEDINKWYIELVKMIKIQGKDMKTKDLDIFIGNNVITNEEVVMEFNDTTKHANSHLAIMGMPGSGKTQFLLKILTDIRKQSEYKTNFIFFDYKGDVVGNQTFIDHTRSRTYKLMQGGEYLPINPFMISDYSEQSILISAREKAESFSSIDRSFGTVQKGGLVSAILAGYEMHKGSDDPFPDFNDIYQIAMAQYEADNHKPDTLIETLRDLSQFNLFWSHGADMRPIDKISNRTMIVDLHSMPVLKELASYLIIERLYKEMVSLPDSAVKDGRRTIRTILVIDEAHNYLQQKKRLSRKRDSLLLFYAAFSTSQRRSILSNLTTLVFFSFPLIK